MATSARKGYTAKFVDGPLEGKTMSVGFLDSGDPQARLEIPAGQTGSSEGSTAVQEQDAAVEPEMAGKRYLYARGSSVEYAEDDPSSERPSAVDYRYLQVLVD